MFNPTDLLIGEAQAIFGLLPSGGDEVDYRCEVVVMATSNTANSTVEYIAPRDGFILGWMTNLASGFVIGVNADLPSSAANPPAGTVRTGLVAWITASIARDDFKGPMKVAFRANDHIQIRTLNATSLFAHLFLGYPQQT